MKKVEKLQKVIVLGSFNGNTNERKRGDVYIE